MAERSTISESHTNFHRSLLVGGKILIGSRSHALGELPGVESGSALVILTAHLL
jgi:hypothetical protein